MEIDNGRHGEEALSRLQVFLSNVDAYFRAPADAEFHCLQVDVVGERSIAICRQGLL